MELKNLQKHIRTLAILPETNAPVVSCYMTLKKGRIDDRIAFEKQIRSLKESGSGKAWRDLRDALDPVDQYLAEELLPDAIGAAIFSRAGEDPFFLPLQFRVPLPNWIALDSTPNIYHLVELKDTYDRYVVLISTREGVRIFAINLGAVIEKLWTENPQIRNRVGREWTKEHYQKHRKEHGQKFIKEKVKILEQLMSAGGYSRLILAGHPANTTQVRKALPKHLLMKLVDIVRVSGKAPNSDVVKATIASFIEAEEKESQAVVETLSKQVRSGGLAVAGTTASYQTLRRGQVDSLVLAKNYAPGLVWACTVCEFFSPARERPATCSECGAAELKNFDLKEEMVRVAERQGCMVEVVNKSEALSQFGGVGCLLRYRLLEDYS